MEGWGFEKRTHTKALRHEGFRGDYFVFFLSFPGLECLLW